MFVHESEEDELGFPLRVLPPLRTCFYPGGAKRCPYLPPCGRRCAFDQAEDVKLADTND